MKTMKAKWLKMGKFLIICGPELMLICSVKVSTRKKTNRQRRLKVVKSTSLARVVEVECDLTYCLARLVQHQSLTNGHENRQPGRQEQVRRGIKGKTHDSSRIHFLTRLDARKSSQVQEEESDEDNIPPIKRITATPKKQGVK